MNSIPEDFLHREGIIKVRIQFTKVVKYSTEHLGEIRQKIQVEDNTLFETLKEGYLSTKREDLEITQTFEYSDFEGWN